MIISFLYEDWRFYIFVLGSGRFLSKYIWQPFFPYTLIKTNSIVPYERQFGIVLSSGKFKCCVTLIYKYVRLTSRIIIFNYSQKVCSTCIPTHYFLGRIWRDIKILNKRKTTISGITSYRWANMITTCYVAYVVLTKIEITTFGFFIFIYILSFLISPIFMQHFYLTRDDQTGYMG